MKKELREGTPKSGWVTFCFNGYDDCDDYLKIIDSIKEVVKPDKITFRGMEDMDGYFIKNGLKVTVEYDSMIGNMLEYENNGTSENLDEVRHWVKQIWDNLN